MPISETCKAYAKSYAQLGWPLFPLHGKQCGILSWDDASTDPEQLEKWSKNNWFTGFGVLTKAAGLIVVDVDIDHENDKFGDDSIRELQSDRGALPTTFRVNTPSGGYHLYYKGVARCKTGIKSGLDVKSSSNGYGGMVVIPGSHKADRTDLTYSIHEHLDLLGDGPLTPQPSVQPAPEWLSQWIGEATEVRDNGISQDIEDVDIDVLAAISYLERSPEVDESERNNAWFQLSAEMANRAISQDKAEELLREHIDGVKIFGTDDAEWMRTLQSAYSNRGNNINGYGSKSLAVAFTDCTASEIEELMTPVAQPDSEDSEASDDEEIVMEGHMNIEFFPACGMNFFYKPGKKKVAIDQRMMVKWLIKHGFKKKYFHNSQEPKLLHSQHRLISDVSIAMIKDYIYSVAVKLPSKVGVVHVTEADLEKDENAKPCRVTKADLMGALDANLHQQHVIATKMDALPTCELEFHTDTPDATHLYYLDTAVAITAKGAYPISYKELKGVVWKSKVIDRDYAPTSEDYKTGTTYRFFNKIMGYEPHRLNQLMLSFGYMLSRHKRGAHCYLIALLDEASDEMESNGGCGKGVWAKALKPYRKMLYIGCRDMVLGKSNKFLWQEYTPDTDVIFMDDLPKHFDFGSMYNIVAEDFRYEGKGIQSQTVPFKDSPKFLAATNYAIKGSGKSDKRRKREIVLANSYTSDELPDGTIDNPLTEFGHYLFEEDFPETEWELCDAFMIECSVQYLNVVGKNAGVPEVMNDSRKYQQLKADTNDTFAEWAIETELVKLGEPIAAQIVARDFNNLTTEAQYVNVKTITPALAGKFTREFATFKGLKQDRTRQYYAKDETGKNIKGMKFIAS